MSTAPDIREVARALRGLLPPTHRAVLFGSRASGHSRPMSDWDIGLVGDHPLDAATLQSIRALLDDWPTLHSFDVVDLARVGAAFRDHALRDAVRLT